MYSASKTRSLSICLIMLISALSPFAVPVSASHESTPTLTLEINDNGTWVEVPSYTDPLIDGVGESGTFEFRFTSTNLTLNDTYSLDWSVEVCDWDDCTEDYEHRNWSAMSTTSTEFWNLTLDIMDCDVEIEATLHNHTSGETWDLEWDMFGPCGNTGDITLVMDTDGDGVDEVIEGFDFDLEVSLEPGIYNASFEIANLASTGSYELAWMVENQEAWIDEEVEWNGSDPGDILEFQISILPWTCQTWVQAFLSEEDATGDFEAISAYVQFINGPCDNPIEISIWDDSTSEWVMLASTEPEATYNYCYWSEEDTRWWCGEDFDENGILDHDEEDDWWYYCERHDGTWYCTDEFGQSADHEDTENNSLLSPMMLEPGTYDVRVNLTWLNDSTHYGVELDGMEPEYVEFNSTSDNFTIFAEMMVSDYDCYFHLGVTVQEDPYNNTGYPTMGRHLMLWGPCEEPVSPFTLTYDGVEYSKEQYAEFDDCTDTGYQYQCEQVYTDEEGNEHYHYQYFQYDDCEEIVDEMVWHCYVGHTYPMIEEGNHSMTLHVEGLEANESYMLGIQTEVCIQTMGCDHEYSGYMWNATSENETVTFYMVTDVFTCDASVMFDLKEESSGSQWTHIFYEEFRFYGPCEEPVSPFTLTYDGVEYSEEQYAEFDDCTDTGYQYQCEQVYTDEEGNEHYHYQYFHYDDCEEIVDEMVWHCYVGHTYPMIEEGNHSMTLHVEGLEANESYMLGIQTEVCIQTMGCYFEEFGYEWNATSENETVTFYMVSDNFTCDAMVKADLFDDEMGHMFHEEFRFYGPCETPPSPFSLTYDGIEWELEHISSEWDDCTPEGDHWECFDYIDCDGDGEEDSDCFMSNWMNECEYSEDGQIWYCVMGSHAPSIDEGNHTMVLTTEDLEIGSNYTIWIESEICEYNGCDRDSMEFDFTATAEEESQTFYLETDNYSCNVRIDVRLEMQDEGHHTQTVAWDHFSFSGPCEEPPSPLSLTYDGIDYPSGESSVEYDACVQDWYDLMCYYDEWDTDQDGEADYHRGHSQEDCSQMDDGTWVCEIYFHETPDLDAGNHTMVLTVEDLDIGSEYNVYLSTSIHGHDHYGGEYMDLDFSADQEAESQTFYLEVSDSTCSVSISVSLYESIDDGDDEDFLWSEGFYFHGPCEYDNPISLFYDIDGQNTEWEMSSMDDAYDHCWDFGYEWICLIDDDFREISSEADNDCNEQADGSWVCTRMMPPMLEAGEYNMTWEISELEDGGNTIHWDLCMHSMMSGSDCEGWSENFTSTSGQTSEVSWTMEIANTTCHASISTYVESNEDHHHNHIGNHFHFNGPCQWEFPVDMSLEIEDENGDWQTVEGLDLTEFMEFEDVDEDDISEEMMEYMMSNVGFTMTDSMEDNVSLMWTLDGLDDEAEYVLFWSFEGPEEGDSDVYWTSAYGYCEWEGSDDDGDTRWWCKDDQSDEDWDTWWYYCEEHEGAWYCTDDFGQSEDFEYSADGSEYLESGENSEEEWMLELSPTGDTHTEDWYFEVPEHFCFGILVAQLHEMETDNTVGMYMAVVMGEISSEDNNGNNIPDCFEHHGDEDDGIQFSPDEFAIGTDYVAQLINVDSSNGTAKVWIAQETTLHDDFRIKVDSDYGNGDGTLNETEAMFFDMWLGSMVSSGECENWDFPATMNGANTTCAIGYQSFENLANNSVGESPVWISGWNLHYEATPNDAGQLTFVIFGDEGEVEEFDSSICGGVEAFGFTIESWSIDGVAQTEDCGYVMANDSFGSIEVVFGPADSDGDGYNDVDDKFPDDPEEWADSDDDGWGDNSDEFPNDPEEHSDIDGDGVGDNADAFPFDPTEALDTDNDGVGDNADAFPNDANETTDTDGDGIGDNADTDMDGDGVNDDAEDSDGDGVNDDQDEFPNDANESVDTDGDGVGDNADAFPSDANESSDTDGDGVGDNSDSDVDGDGVDNEFDDFPLDSSQTSDADGDGVGDSEDAFPNDPDEYIDTDGDGTGNNADPDDDGDGTPDVADAFPLDASEDTDTDMDGFGNNVDAFDNDAGEWVDTDGDGVGDNSDAFPADPRESADSDGDGVGDNTDAFINDPNEIMDSDGDGVGNNADDFPYDADEQKDTDGDGVGDNADTDADGDGVPDDPSDVPDADDDDGGILPGFSAVAGLASMLGAAVLIAGRRKD